MSTDTPDTAAPETGITAERPADADSDEIAMRILKVGTASSLSNRSILGYAIGCDDTGAIHLSLRSNTASGMFSKNWLALLDIAHALVHADLITSSTLLGLYANTSRNNAGFMLAVLLGEGLVCPMERYYQRQDFKPFLHHLKVLMDAGVDLGDADEALQALEASDAADVAEVDAVEVVALPVAKRGRPSKRA